MKKLRVLLIANLSTPVLRDIAANHDTARHATYGVAENVSPIESGNEWMMIAPYGEFPHPKGQQVFAHSHADKMVAAFSSVSGRLGRMFRGLPIYIGHPDVDPERWPDDRRVGRINGLEAREDGLYGKVAWNDLGQKNVAEGYHVYPSPAWLFPKNNIGRIEPDELVSVGLTNTPQIRESRPWTNSQDKTAGDPGTTTTNMPPWLLELLGLKPEATEDEAKQALTALKQKGESAAAAIAAREVAEGEAANAKARVTTLSGQLTAANSATVAAQQAHAKTLLDTAINDGRLTAAERPEYETAFNADFSTGQAKLAGKAKAMNTQEIQLGDRKQSIASASERRIVVNSAVAEYQGKGMSYDEAWNAASQDPRYKAAFEAMQTPKKG